MIRMLNDLKCVCKAAGTAGGTYLAIGGEWIAWFRVMEKCFTLEDEGAKRDKVKTGIGLGAMVVFPTLMILTAKKGLPKAQEYLGEISYQPVDNRTVKEDTTE